MFTAIVSRACEKSGHSMKLMSALYRLGSVTVLQSVCIFYFIFDMLELWRRITHDDGDEVAGNCAFQ